MIKMLRPDQIWQPRVGAPPGNRNALTHGRQTRAARALRARIRDVRRRAHAAIRAVERGL